MIKLDIEPETEHLLAVIAFFIVILLPALFWMRGIIKNCKGDMIVGCVLLFFVNPVAMYFSNGPCVSISGLGVAMILYGLATVIASWFAKPDCPLQKKDRSALAAGFIIFGFLLSAMV